MYDKHIKALEAAKDYEEPGPAAIAAFDAAIALMRAAGPKDAQAEREHCDRVAIELANVRAPKGARGGAADHFQSYAQDKIVCERAAVRAHYEAMLADMRKPKNAAAEREHCRGVFVIEAHADLLETERAAARAEGAAIERENGAEEARSEIERLQTIASKLATQVDEQERKLWPGKLSEARSEIERLKAENQNLVDQEVGGALQCWQHEKAARAEERAVWETKLANLRAAVERYRELKSNATWGLVLDAIEESK